ncbi:MAG: P-loop NTPase [Syntrophobacteria bacterium]
MKISVCGKGGSGKSTVVSLLAGQAEARAFKVLVVDSDESNTSLFRMLGFEKAPVPLMELLGGKRRLKEKMAQPEVLAEDRIFVEDIPSQYLVRRNRLALVSIGKILQALEGCACPMGVLSREFLKKLVLHENEIAVVDMEAGIEHFGRGIDTSLDGVVVLVEPSFESITVAEKIRGLAAGMDKNLWAVLNKISSESLAEKLRGELQKRDIETAGVIPEDPGVFAAGLEGKAFNRGDASRAAGEVLDFLLSRIRDRSGREICV